ncbi:MAG TPA: CBS domain-containing protein [Allosphingosinicella sp.]|jgi:CBS domain-containing protein
MTIAAILDAKGRSVVTVDAAAPVRDAVRLLAEHRIGAVVVMEGETVAGILSERDLVYCIAREGAAALDLPAARMMTAPVITVEPSVNALAALSNMSKRRIRHLPVVEGEKLAGLVSIGDLVAWRIRKIEDEAEAMRAYIQGA